jgi:hypothetical protein
MWAIRANQWLRADTKGFAGLHQLERGSIKCSPPLDYTTLCNGDFSVTLALIHTLDMDGFPYANSSGKFQEINFAPL